MSTPRMKKARRVSKLVAMMMTAGVCASSVLAANVPGGSTLEPIPAVALPAGAVQEQIITKPYSYTGVRYINSPNGPLPFPAPVSGNITQRVYRLSDNTITFAYSISNSSDSQQEPVEFYARDYSEYTTDIFQFNGLINVLTTQGCNRAVRSGDGSIVQFDIDSGLDEGKNTNTVYIRTNSTAYTVPGRFTISSSRVTVSGGGGSNSVYGFAYPVEDSTPPIVSLSTPAQLADVCNPVAITGRAYDPNGFDEYKLEFASSPNGPWTLISSSSMAVSSTGPLGSWNTTSVSQGYYFLRLSATNTTGMSNSVTSMVFVDKQFDSVEVRSPVAGQILGGAVCFDGSVNDGNGVSSAISYTISYAPLPSASPFLPVNPAQPTYPQGVINDGLGSWQTASGPTAVADGAYRVRVTGTDHCGNSKTVSRDIIIDNTRPVAAITSPTSCGNVSGLVTITGNVSDANMAGWTLQYTGGDAAGWVTIASGSSNVSGTLATWNTTGLRPCAYSLRLIAGDAAGVNCSGHNNQTEMLVSVNVGCPADFNRSGAVSVQDIFDFLNEYFIGCP